jgi:outer membrane protein assembly factor BamB
LNKNILAIGILFLFIVSSVAPLSFGINISSGEQSSCDDLQLEDYYGCYSLEEIPESIRSILSENDVSQDISKTTNLIKMEEPLQPSEGPMDSPWPMYCHDVRHTGRSPYRTVGNPGYEKWRFDVIETCLGSPVIDDTGIIYIGARHLFAVYPNGTLKWKYEEPIKITSAPAIDENGVLYVGGIWVRPQYMYAIYMNNGTVKWKYKVGEDIWSSPAIGDDGSIYFGSENDYIYALYPNGTLKWKYLTSVAVYSSPAIGTDGTVYCGSHDEHLYAFYPNNGTVKWKYKTGHWIRTSPCIADDGTIYVVSLDNHLHAVYPNNGTGKWKTNVGAGTSPTIGQDGTIYCGYNRLHAVNPDGTIKWSFNPGEDRAIRGATPCNSDDGFIYFGTHIGETDGGELISVNPDGTERWRIEIATVWTDSAPAIGEDGTVYIGSWDRGPPHGWGWLHAIGPYDPDAPTAPVINGETNGDAGEEYQYTVKSTSPVGRDVYYYINWGDGNVMDWFGPFSSGEEIKLNHTYTKKRTYIIKSHAKDTDNLWGPWGELKVIMPRNKATYNPFFLNLLERFPLFKQLMLFFHFNS